jgi:hypothetical protein
MLFRASEMNGYVTFTLIFLEVRPSELSPLVFIILQPDGRHKLRMVNWFTAS